MKQQIILLHIFILTTLCAYGQWNYNGSYIYYNGGNVGIGTASPSNIQGWSKVLDVSATSCCSKIIATADNAAFRGGFYTHNSWYGGGGFVGTESNHNLFFNTNYSAKMVLTTSGNLGVANFSPEGLVHLGASNLGLGSTKRLLLEPPYHSGGAWEFRVRDDASSSYLGIGYATESVSIHHEGRVGIGTLAPVGLLEIKGPYSGNSQLIINSTSSAGELRFSDNGTPKGFVWYNQTGNYMAFGRGSVSNSMFVNSSGDFGIGTTAPDSKLTVKGTIHTQEVKVDLNGAVAPDYVFEKDYALTSLEELKSYIDQNKHLPEIPSAKEMEENGINLKEMNLLLLRKIEEMTLYMLQQEQRIKQLENKQDK